MSTEVCTSLGPSASPDLANSSASNVAPGIKYDVACPSPTPDINSSPTITSDGLANLTPLPTQSPNEIQDLDPNYPNYRATIHYYSLSPSGALTQETHPNSVSRTSVLLSLEYFYTLRKHLTASLSILSTHPDTALAETHESSSSSRRSATLTPLERAQNEFSMHHIAINENLRAVNSDWGCHAFGLPDPLAAASDVRRDRNFFAHSFPTPGGKGVQFVWAVEGKRGVYGRLLGLVEGGICGLQGQLDDPGIWVSPQVIEKERLEREAREEDERLDTEGVERDDDEDCVVEQEDDVECMEPTQSTFSRVFDSLGGNVVFRYCFRFGIVRRAGWMLFDWMGEILSEADAVALRRAEEGASEECGEGDDWGSQEDEIGDDSCGSQEYRIEDGDCRSQEYEVGDDECHGSRTLDAHPPQPDSGWGDPQW